MAVYDRVPGMDSEYNFPPEVRRAVAGSNEVINQIETEIGNDDTIHAAVLQAIEEALAAGNVSFNKGQTSASQNLGTLTVPGLYTYGSGNIDKPTASSGIIIVSEGGAPLGMQLAITSGFGQEIYTRFRGSGGYSAWERKDAGAKDPIVVDTAGFDVDLIDTNSEHVFPITTGVNLPGPFGGWLITRIINSQNTQRMQIFYKNGYGTGPTRATETYMRFRGSGGYSAWYRTDVDGFDFDLIKASGGESPEGGYKTYPLILSAGSGGSSNSPTSANVKYTTTELSPLIPTMRYRIALVDGNPRFGLKRSNQISITNLKVGGTTKLSSATTPSNGDIWYSPYFTGPLGDVEFDYVAAQAPIANVGGGYLNGTRVDMMPFEIWIEVEVPSWVPGAGLFGNSNSVGVGTTIPIHDSYWALYCKEKGLFPIFYGHSGDTMANSLDAKAWKYTRFNHLSRPNMMMMMMGSNDLGSGTLTLTEYQTRFEQVVSIIAENICSVIHVGTLKPRNDGAGNYNTVRKQVNTWLKTLPFGVREWHDLNTPVSSDDLTILPAYNADGTHMNSAGHAKLSTSFTKLILALEKKVSTAVGRTIELWDWATNKYDLISGDTGLRSIAPYDGVTGFVFIRRVGKSVTLFFRDIVTPETGTIITLIPTGFRPDYAPRYDILGRNGSRELVAFTLNTTSINQNGTKTGSMYGSATFNTNDPWPTSLPGTPA